MPLYQVNLRNVNRQKYVCLHLSSSENKSDATTDQLRVSSLIPWGVQSLVTLEFGPDGRYGIRTCDDRYLSRDGTLVSTTGPNTSFAVELKAAGAGSAGLALRDSTGRYLTGVGRDAVVQARNSSAGKDELFAVEESHPQAFITAHNGKMVSIKQGTLYAKTSNGKWTRNMFRFWSNFDRHFRHNCFEVNFIQLWRVDSRLTERFSSILDLLANFLRNAARRKASCPSPIYSIEYLPGRGNFFPNKIQQCWS